MRCPHTLAGWFSLTVFIGSVLTGGSLAADPEPYWPQVGGPNRDNRSTETELLKEWPEGGPKRLWTAQGIGEGFSSVSIADGSIYTAGNIDGSTVITALDMDGKIRWQVRNGKSWEKPTGGTRSTPTVDGGRLYHKNPFGDLVCLDAKTGNRIWGLNILEKFGSKNIVWGLAESLLIDGEHLICCPGGPRTAVVALDKNSGKTVWASPSAGELAGYSSPTLAECDGLRMILVLNSKALIGVNADGGDLLWRHPRITPYNENIIRPIFHDRHVFIATSFQVGGELLKVDVDGKKASVQTEWLTKQYDNQHGGVLLLDGYLYGACHKANGGKWACLDWKTGKVVYADEGVGRGSLTYADGMLYTLSERRVMGLVKATPNSHEVVGRFRLPEGGQGPSWAWPVVCGGRLYIRYSDFLHVYDVGRLSGRKRVAG